MFDQPLNHVQRERYEMAYKALHAALADLQRMIGEYPTPDEVIDPALAFALEDLRRRIEALTACWVGVG